MSNICFNQVVFYSHNRSAVDGVASTIKNLVKEGGRTWLGNLLMGLKPSITEEEIDDSDIIFVSSVYGFGDVNTKDDLYYINVEISSDWEPPYEALQWIIDGTDLQFVMLSEEEGELIFVNTDKNGLFFKERYFLDLDNGDYGNDNKYLENEDQALKEAESFYGRKFKSMDDVEKYCDKNEYLYVFEEFGDWDE